MSIFCATQQNLVSPSSILKKTPRLKPRLSNGLNKSTKVRFVLPHSKRVRTILLDFAENHKTRDYESMVCLIRDADLTDEDISSLLSEATECISLLNQDLKLFVEALLSITWNNRTEHVVGEFQAFIVALLSAHNYHAKYVIHRLTVLFLPGKDESIWDNGQPSEVDCVRCANVHYLLSILLRIIPLCKELLMASLRLNYPYYTRPTHSHEYYLHNLLWILEYQPSFRPDIFHLIFSKLVILDANSPREEVLKLYNQEDEEPIFDMDCDGNSSSFQGSAFTKIDVHVTGFTLDVCLDKMFTYFITECHNNDDETENWNKIKRLYQDILTIFDRIILPTYNIHHVQFIIFLLCCFKPAITEAFLNYLWKKVCNPNIAPVLRQTSIAYISSFIARATFVPVSMLKGTLQQMSQWILSYISTQDGLDCVNNDLRVHLVFYSVCQSFFYLIAFRHKVLVTDRKDLVFLESLNMTKIINCRLNPLRVCQPAVVQNFAAVTRKYQLAYCYSIIEHNARNTMAVIYQGEKGNVIMSNNVLDGFFPFDPYVLRKSGYKLKPFYREYQAEMEETVNESKDLADVDDDFLYQHHESSASANLKTFSYGSSPGFKFNT